MRPFSFGPENRATRQSPPARGLLLIIAAERYPSVNRAWMGCVKARQLQRRSGTTRSFPGPQSRLWPFPQPQRDVGPAVVHHVGIVGGAPVAFGKQLRREALGIILRSIIDTGFGVVPPVPTVVRDAVDHRVV